MWNLLFRIAIVQRPHPEKCRGLVWPPANGAWASDDAIDGDLIR